MGRLLGHARPGDRGAAFGENVILMSGGQDTTVQAKGRAVPSGLFNGQLLSHRPPILIRSFIGESLFQNQKSQKGQLCSQFQKSKSKTSQIRKFQFES